MPKDERRKHDKAMKKKKQLEEDMLPEVMLREEIEMTKKRVNCKDPIFERVRAYIPIEGDEK
jgi:prophage antirepressor-like protein